MHDMLPKLRLARDFLSAKLEWCAHNDQLELRLARDFLSAKLGVMAGAPESSCGWPAISYQLNYWHQRTQLFPVAVGPRFPIS